MASPSSCVWPGRGHSGRRGRRAPPRPERRSTPARDNPERIMRLWVVGPGREAPGGSGLHRALRGRWAGVVVGLAGVAVVTELLDLLSEHVNVVSLAVCYQLLVLAVSGGFGAVAGLVT